jgi:hypothetical protein
MEPTRANRGLQQMKNDPESQAIALRERRIDEALRDSFPASDTPYFVGSGAAHPPGKATRRNRSAEMASEVIDQSADLFASSEEQHSRKRRLLKGPKEFQKFRRDHPD